MSKGTPTFTIVTGAERPLEFMQECDASSALEWPAFMLHDPVSHRYWPELYERFPEYQFALVATDTNDILAVGRSLPFAWSGNFPDLPKKVGTGCCSVESKTTQRSQANRFNRRWRSSSLAVIAGRA